MTNPLGSEGLGALSGGEVLGLYDDARHVLLLGEDAPSHHSPVGRPELPTQRKLAIPDGRRSWRRVPSSGRAGSRVALPVPAMHGVVKGTDA